MRIRFLLGSTAVLLMLLGAIPARAEDPGLRLEKEIPLPGVEGRIDHISVDEAGQRLFVAALGNGSVEIVDLRKGERTAEIKGLEEPQGLYYDSKTDRLLVATGGDGKLRVYEGKSLVLQETQEFGEDADNVRYDQQTGDVWVGYGNGIAIVNSAGQKVGSIALGSHPESFQFGETGDRAYVHTKDQQSRAEGWFEVIVGKSMSQDGESSKCFGFVRNGGRRRCVAAVRQERDRLVHLHSLRSRLLFTANAELRSS